MHVGDEEKNKIWYLASKEKLTGLQISKRLGISKSTVYRIIAEKKKGQASAVASAVARSIDSNPLQYRLNKIESIKSDIEAARARGSVHVLPSLHKLEIELHDQITSLKKEDDEFNNELSADECIATIIAAASKLPPILKDRLFVELSKIDQPNIIEFQGQKDVG